MLRERYGELGPTSRQAFWTTIAAAVTSFGLIVFRRITGLPLGSGLEDFFNLVMFAGLVVLSISIRKDLGSRRPPRS